MVKTETVPSLRLATSASVPALLIDTPAAPWPACRVASTLGAGVPFAPDADGRFDAAEQARLQRRQVDHGELVVGNHLARIGGIDALTGRDQREFLLRRNGHVERRADDAVGDLDLGQHLGLRGPHIDDGHGIRPAGSSGLRPCRRPASPWRRWPKRRAVHKLRRLSPPAAERQRSRQRNDPVILSPPMRFFAPLSCNCCVHTNTGVGLHHVRQGGSGRPVLVRFRFSSAGHL